MEMKNDSKDKMRGKERSKPKEGKWKEETNDTQ